MGTRLRTIRFSEGDKKRKNDEGLLAARPAKAGRAAVAAVRLAFAIVFAVNVQCAVSFVLWPGNFTAAYELSGVPGETAVRGIGVAFLMWNATYPAVIANPRRFRALAVVVVAQQLIGLAGESFILATLPQGHTALAAAITRFIAFDAAGLALMAASLVWLAVTEIAQRRRPSERDGEKAGGGRPL